MTKIASESKFLSKKIACPAILMSGLCGIVLCSIRAPLFTILNAPWISFLVSYWILWCLKDDRIFTSLLMMVLLFLLGSAAAYNLPYEIGLMYSICLPVTVVFSKVIYELRHTKNKG